MTHRGPFQPLTFCDSVICRQKEPSRSFNSERPKVRSYSTSSENHQIHGPRKTVTKGCIRKTGRGKQRERSEQLRIQRLYLVAFTVKIGSYVSGDIALSADIMLPEYKM